MDDNLESPSSDYGVKNDDWDLLPPLESTADCNQRDEAELSSSSNIKVDCPGTVTAVVEIARKRKNDAIKRTKNDERKVQTKKMIKDDEKLAKRLIRNELKSQQPKECMKYMQIYLDSCLKFYLNDDKDVLKTSLQQICRDSEVIDDQNLIRNNLVCWKRKNPNDFSQITTESDFCLILRNDDLIIDLDFLKHLRRSLPIGHRLTLLLLSSIKSNFASRKNRDDQLFEICFPTSTNYNFVSNLDELARYLAAFTKSVAEKLYKQHKKETQDFLTFAPCTDRQKTNVVLKGQPEAERRFVWRRMVHAACGSRPNAEQAAKSICEKYPSARLLLEAYDQQQNEREGELLLQNIVADPVTAVRVGPAISTAIYRVFTCKEPHALVDKNS